jgi:hypothetical protein
MNPSNSLESMRLFPGYGYGYNRYPYGGYYPGKFSHKFPRVCLVTNGFSYSISRIHENPQIYH